MLYNDTLNSSKGPIALQPDAYLGTDNTSWEAPDAVLVVTAVE